MIKWTYNLATGEFVTGGPCEPPYDPATEAVVRLPRNPDKRTEKYDPATQSVIAKLPAEIAAYDDAQRDAEAQAVVTTDKKLIALAEYLRQELNTVRAALVPPLPTITRVQALAAIRTILKGL